jgi:ATP-binding cassette subfamily B protein
LNTFEEQDYSEKFDVGLWKKIFQFCKPHKRIFLTLAVSGLVLAFSEAMLPLFTGYAIDTFVVERNLETLPLFIVLFVLLMFVICFTIYLFIDYAGRAETIIARDIRRAGFKKLMKLSFSYYDKTPVGWIMARMTSDTNRIGDMVAWSTIDVVWSFTFIIMAIGFMLMTDVRLTLLLLLVSPIMVIISLYFQKKILAGHRESRKFNSKITGAYNEGIMGARTTKTLVREEKNFEEFQELSGGMRRASIRAFTISSLYFPVILFTTSIGIAIVLGEGGRSVIEEYISLGTLSVFIVYAGLLSDPIGQLAQVISEIKGAQAAGERTIALLETDLDIVDSQELVELYGDFLEPKSENWHEIKGDIQFDEVSFSYKTGEQVLEDFNLNVKAGEKIALVGETGSGKSTIVNLLCRFYEPTKGRILIDGLDYKQMPQIWIQSNLGYVLQSPHLFSGSIKENIRYGNLEATDEEIEEAAKLVGAYEFIGEMEKDFDFDVGEGGSRLSTGQKQLISFARAIVGAPSIFVLDEATSSIDTESEQIIQKAIYKILEGRTSFIVAHRLSTIRHCDRILVIDKGKIIEIGTHKELIKEKGHYYSLYTNQFKKESEDKILSQEGK